MFSTAVFPSSISSVFQNGSVQGKQDKIHFSAGSSFLNLKYACHKFLNWIVEATIYEPRAKYF